MNLLIKKTKGLQTQGIYLFILIYRWDGKGVFKHTFLNYNKKTCKYLCVIFFS